MLVRPLSEAGTLLDLQDTTRIKSGLVVLVPGEEVGTHVTHDREEVVIVLEGAATVECEGDETREVAAGHLVYIGRNKQHNLINKGSSTLRYVYIVALDT